MYRLASAMNLTDEQKQALNTLPIGSAVIRLADEHPEPFLVKIPLCSVQEGSVSDTVIKANCASYYTDSSPDRTTNPNNEAVPPIPLPDKNNKMSSNKDKNTHPPSPKETLDNKAHLISKPAPKALSREEIRFLTDIAVRPLSTTVSRYHRLHLSPRRGNAVRQALALVGIIERVTISTRSGQVVLYQLTDFGRTVCSQHQIDPGPRSRESLEHSFWVNRAVNHFEKEGYEVSLEYQVKGNGAIDVMAQKPGQMMAIEVETGKSDIKENLRKIKDAGFDRIVFVATSPVAVAACHKAIGLAKDKGSTSPEILTWLDFS